MMLSKVNATYLSKFVDETGVSEKKYTLQRMNFVNNHDKIRSFHCKWPQILPYLVPRGGMITMIIHIMHQNSFSKVYIFFHSWPNILNVAVTGSQLQWNKFLRLSKSSCNTLPQNILQVSEALAITGATPTVMQWLIF